MSNQVLQNIDRVMQQFLSTQQLIMKLGVEATIVKLEEDKDLFQSVGFEAISMAIADNILQEEILDWSEWDKIFSKYKNQFASQFLTGLGWAFAKNEADYLEKLNTFSAFKQARVLDGYGYFYGLFRSRICVRGAVIPESISEKELPFFDMGLGRSLWYLSKGNLEQVSKFLVGFNEKRLPSLVLGIGLASTFVGGLSSDELSTLHLLSGDYQSVFEKGVLLANRSCYESNNVSFEMENHIKQLFQLTSEEAYQKVQNRMLSSNFIEKLFDLNENFLTLSV